MLSPMEQELPPPTPSCIAAATSALVWARPTPEELVERAHALGYDALAITDECSVSGVVRAHTEAKRLGLKLLPGAEFEVPMPSTGGVAGFRLIVLPHDLSAWGDLCEFITRGAPQCPQRPIPGGAGWTRPGPAWPDAKWCWCCQLL